METQATNIHKLIDRDIYPSYSLLHTSRSISIHSCIPILEGDLIEVPELNNQLFRVVPKKSGVFSPTAKRSLYYKGATYYEVGVENANGTPFPEELSDSTSSSESDLELLVDWSDNWTGSKNFTILPNNNNN